MIKDIEAFKTAILSAIKEFTGDLPIEGCLVKANQVRVDRIVEFKTVLKIEIKAQILVD